MLHWPPIARSGFPVTRLVLALAWPACPGSCYRVRFFLVLLLCCCGCHATRDALRTGVQDERARCARCRKVFCERCQPAGTLCGPGVVPACRKCLRAFCGDCVDVSIVVCYKTSCNCEPLCVCDVVCVECRDDRCRKCHHGMSRQESISVRLRKKAWGRVRELDGPLPELTDGANGPLPIKSATESGAELKASRMAAELVAMEESGKSEDKKLSKNAKKKKRRQQKKAHKSKPGDCADADVEAEADADADEGLVIDADDDYPNENGRHDCPSRRPSSEMSDRSQHDHDREACGCDDGNRSSAHHQHGSYRGHDHQHQQHGSDAPDQGAASPTAAVPHGLTNATATAALDDVARDARIESVGILQEAITAARIANAASVSVHSATKVLKRLLRAADLQEELATATVNPDAARLVSIIAKTEATPIRIARLVAPELVKAAKALKQALASSGDLDAETAAAAPPAVVVVEEVSATDAPVSPVGAVITASAVVAATGGPADGFRTPERVPTPPINSAPQALGQAFQAGTVCAANPWAQVEAFRDVELIQDAGSLAWAPHHSGSSAETPATSLTSPPRRQDRRQNPRSRLARRSGSTRSSPTTSIRSAQRTAACGGGVRVGGAVPTTAAPSAMDRAASIIGQQIGEAAVNVAGIGTRGHGRPAPPVIPAGPVAASVTLGPNGRPVLGIGTRARGLPGTPPAVGTRSMGISITSLAAPAERTWAAGWEWQAWIPDRRWGSRRRLGTRATEAAAAAVAAWRQNSTTALHRGWEWWNDFRITFDPPLREIRHSATRPTRHMMCSA